MYNETSLAHKIDPYRKIYYFKCSKISNTKCLPKGLLLDSVGPDQTASEKAVPVCYFDNLFVNSSPKTNNLFEYRNSKVFKILENLL